MALFIRAIVDKSWPLLKNYCNKLSLNEINSRKFSDVAPKSIIFKGNKSQKFSKLNKHGSTKQSSKYSDNDSAEVTKTFENLIATRRKESKNSVVIQVQSPESYKDLYYYCSGFGDIKNMFYYTLPNSMNFFLVEYKNYASQKALLKSSDHTSNSEITPVQSPILWFRSSKTTGLKESKCLPPLIFSSESSNLLPEILQKKRHIGEQMQLLYETCKLQEIGIRLRFITARQIETSFSSLFSNIMVLPFGSSVNGFGKHGCDLDLVLSIDNNKLSKVTSRLVYHAKSASDEKEQTKKTMEMIASVLKDFIPGVKNVRKILLARVPIIKYNQAFTGLECDLSMTNMTAVYMSELLYLYGEIDNKVRPLVFTIRHWAAAVGITNHNPGNWITNFSLTILILFYLQQKFILPSIDTLKKLADASDIRIAHYTDADCTFLRDINKWPKSKHNSNNNNNYSLLRDLLYNFFQFYANYDFTNYAISLREGKSFYKPDNSPLYIRNPLEKSLNISKNVSVSEIVRFVDANRNALMLMDEENETCTRGLLDIFSDKKSKKTITSYQNSINETKIKIAELFQIENNKNDHEIENTKRKT